MALREESQSPTLLSRIVLGEWLAGFRGKNGQAVALSDRYIYRNSRLFCRSVSGGKLPSAIFPASKSPRDGYREKSRQGDR